MQTFIRICAAEKICAHPYPFMRKPKLFR